MNEPDTAERWALLRTMLGTDGIVASEALTEMCGMFELMLDPHKDKVQSDLTVLNRRWVRNGPL